jgi:predicted thioredoxin/glutaredoxin
VSAVITSTTTVPDTTTIVVNVSVQRTQAAVLAARAAVGRVALVLDPQS